MGLCVLMYTKNITTQKLAACLILWEKTPTPLSPQGVKFQRICSDRHEERQQRERRERPRAKTIRRRAREEDRPREVSMLHLETFLLVAEADRVLYHLIMF